jgi:hypothetical protein
MNVPLILAGSIALLGAAIHGGAGEVLVVRKLTPQMLPSTRLGGPGTTMLMIRGSWHMTTIAFVTVGSALLLSGSVLNGDVARGMSLGGAIASTGFATIAVVGAFLRSPRAFYRHPAPALLTLVAILAWWGTL